MPSSAAPWLQERPQHLGGTWALGCQVCHHRSQSILLAKAGQPRRAHRKLATPRRDHRNEGRASKWARYGVNWLVSPQMGVKEFRQHANTQAHRLACKALGWSAASMEVGMAVPLAPAPLQEAAVGAASGAVAGAAEEAAVGATQGQEWIFRGRVPQAKEWVDAWVDNTSMMSFRQQATIAKKRGDKVLQNRNRIRRKQLTIMAEVARRGVRKNLMRAQVISLSIDEAQRKKIMRFRCDSSTAPYHVEGVLGVIDCDRSCTENLEEDHAIMGVRKLEAVLLGFCTPLSSPVGSKRLPLAPDLELYEHILKCVLVFAADGAASERRTIFLAARRLFKNMIYVIRDSCHAIRISVKNPLHHDDVFGEVWAQLFDKRHALVPDIQNSEKWQNILQAIQEEVLAIPGVARPIEHVLKHFQFAKQRFDSTADPMAKLACLLLPVSTLLAFISSDERNNPHQRSRASETLKKLTSKFCLALALSADWGVVCAAFLHLFDKRGHDIASSRSEIDTFIETLTTLFIDGYVFSPASTGEVVLEQLQRYLVQRRNGERTAAPLPDVMVLPLAKGFKGRPAFVTELVERQVRAKTVFRCGRFPILTWGPLVADELRDLAGRMGNVARVVIDRLKAEFPREDIRSWMQCFEVRRVRLAFGDAPDLAMRTVLLAAVKKLATALGQTTVFNADPAAAVLEYGDVAPFIVKISSPGERFEKVDNRLVFGTLLEPSRLQEACPSRAAPFEAMPFLVRFYIAIEDGECSVERDLASNRAERDCHVDQAHQPLLDDKAVLQHSGPKTRADVVAREETRGAALQLTEVGMEWAGLWREVFGARLGIYNVKHGPPKLQGKGHEGTWAACKRGVLVAAGLAVAKQRRSETDNKTNFAVRRSFFADASGGTGLPLATMANKYWNKSFAKFSKATQLKARMNVNLSGARSRVYYPRFKPRRAAAVAADVRVERVCFVGCQGPEQGPERDKSKDPVNCKAVTGADKCATADLVVVKDLETLYGSAGDGADDDWFRDRIYIYGLGKPVTTESSWEIAERDPKKLAKGSVVHHLAASSTRDASISYTTWFELHHAQMFAALKRCSKLTNPMSKWTVSKRSKRKDAKLGLPLATTRITVDDSSFDDLEALLTEIRLTRNTLGQKVFTASGGRAG